MRPGRTSGTATVLFTDLVGSTELMTRLGDLAYDELRAEHFARLRESVLTHEGDEVKNTGDGLLSMAGGPPTGAGRLTDDTPIVAWSSLAPGHAAGRSREVTFGRGRLKRPGGLAD